jgi:23S rRNA A2030 N6-methylase RlmJ
VGGSGLLLVNPPYEFDTRMQAWLPELAAVLGGAAAAGGTSAQAGSSIDWILHGH